MREATGTTAPRLLDWYDRHARDLPWRVAPARLRAGVRPDPYRVWLSEVMLQQTVVATVIARFETFTRKWPDVHRLAAAQDADVMAAWAGLGYYARARNLLKCARVVSGDLRGRFPDTVPALRDLPGIGPYTAAAIAAIAFGRGAVVVDGNVERVVARLFAVETPLPEAKTRLHRLAGVLTPEERPGDYAQAMMDLGATICTPRSPSCGRCPIRENCAALETGVVDRLPRRTPKKAKPTRRGIAYYVEREDGALLLETRPPRGLLGGMTGFPGSEWVSGTPVNQPPVAADWRIAGEVVRHTFTHFHLELKVHHARVEQSARAARGRFAPHNAGTVAALPTLMRKVHALVARST